MRGATDTAAALRGFLSRRVPAKAHSVKEAGKIVSRCLAEAPERRWQSVAELERELAAVPASGSRSRLVIADALGLLVLFAAGYRYLHRTPKLSAKDTIVLGEFENKTGDAVFDQTLHHGLAVQFWKARLQNSETSMSCGYAPATAAPEMSSLRNRRKPEGKKRS